MDKPPYIELRYNNPIIVTIIHTYIKLRYNNPYITIISLWSKEIESQTYHVDKGRKMKVRKTQEFSNP